MWSNARSISPIPSFFQSSITNVSSVEYAEMGLDPSWNYPHKDGVGQLLHSKENPERVEKGGRPALLKETTNDDVNCSSTMKLHHLRMSVWVII